MISVKSISQIHNTKTFQIDIFLISWEILPFFIKQKQLYGLWLVARKVCFGYFNQNLMRQIQFELAIGDLVTG